MVGRTSLLIAHCLSTVGGADEILVLDQTRLIEQRRYDELIAQDSLDNRLYETQFKSERYSARD